MKPTSHVTYENYKLSAAEVLKLLGINAELRNVTATIKDPMRLGETWSLHVMVMREHEGAPR